MKRQKQSRMIRCTITPTISLSIPDKCAAYHVHGHDVSVCLNECGTYTTEGVDDEHDARYQQITREVTERMVAACQQRERILRTLHTAAPRIWLESEVTEYMARMQMSQFRPTPFPLFRPVTTDVQRELEHEAEIKFGNILADRSAERELFVNSRLKAEYEARVRAWTDALAFHKQVQEYKQAQFNTHHKTEYEQRMLSMRSFMQGEAEYVNNRIRALLESLKLPFRVNIRCIYHEQEQRLVTQVELPEKLGLPRHEALIQPDGRIKLVEKSKYELLQLQTETILSVVYLVAATLFQASTNISTHKVNVWLHNRVDALLAVEFSRADMAQTDMKHLYPLADYHKHRRRDNIQVDEDVIRFLPMGIKQSSAQSDMAAEPEAEYKNSAVNRLSRAHKHQEAYRPGGTNWEAGMDIAEALRDALPDDSVLNIMVNAAMAVGQKRVRLPRKYERIWQKIHPTD